MLVLVYMVYKTRTQFQPWGPEEITCPKIPESLATPLCVTGHSCPSADGNVIHTKDISNPALEAIGTPTYTQM